MENKRIKNNIDNLTSLWKTVCAPFDSLRSTRSYKYCSIKNSDWPNRLWFEKVPNEDEMAEAIKYIRDSEVQLTFPHWFRKERELSTYIKEKEFSNCFEQSGMSFSGSEPFQVDQSVSIQLLHSEIKAVKWAEAYQKSFGYRISRDIIMETYDKLNYYLILNKGVIAGTAIVFSSDNTFGIHGVGVIPEMRRKGIAEESMKHLLNQSISQKIPATLQASPMGRDLYLKLGFKEDFRFGNYVR